MRILTPNTHWPRFGQLVTAVRLTLDRKPLHVPVFDETETVVDAFVGDSASEADIISVPIVCHVDVRGRRRCSTTNDSASQELRKVWSL